MGLDPALAHGNRVYRWSHEDLDPILDRINQFLALTPEEESEFLSSRRQARDSTGASDRLLDYHRANLETLKLRAHAATSAGGGVGTAPPPTAQAPSPARQTPLAMVGHILSAWGVAPLVFLFVLRDTGEIKRGLLSVLPNRLFEPALTILADLDRAVGDFVRGIFLECVALGLTVTVLLAVVGVPPRWAMAIGIFTAATNVVPYMGSGAALVAGLAYAFLGDEIHPLLPMVNAGNFALWVIAALGVAALLDNVVYEPLLLGGAVQLHPLVVVIGMVGGGILFDFAGVLLAVPIIAVCKALASSSLRQLKAYGLT